MCNENMNLLRATLKSLESNSITKQSFLKILVLEMNSWKTIFIFKKNY